MEGDIFMSGERIQNHRKTTAVLHVGLLLSIVFLASLTLRRNVFASAYFFGNYDILRPGETTEEILYVSIPSGDTYHYVSSNPKIVEFNCYTRESSNGRKLSITAKKRGVASLLVKSDKSGTIAKMTIQVANYKQYWGVSFKSKLSKNYIKRISISGNKLIINGKPKLVKKNGSKQLKYKSSRSFKLTKNTYYGYADAGIFVNKGKKAKKEARKMYKAPVLHVYVEGKKVLAYFSSC